MNIGPNKAEDLLDKIEDYIMTNTTTVIRDTKISIIHKEFVVDDSGHRTVKANKYSQATRSIDRIIKKHDDENTFDHITSDWKYDGTNDRRHHDRRVDGKVPHNIKGDKKGKEQKPTPTVDGDDPKSVMNTYLKQKASGLMNKTENRQGRTGRAKKGVKTIRYITMEILEHHWTKGTLTEDNRDNIVKEIMKKADVDERTAKHYFSGHKHLWV